MWCAHLAEDIDNCLPRNLDRWMLPPFVQMLALAAVRFPESEPPYFVHASATPMSGMHHIGSMPCDR